MRLAGKTAIALEAGQTPGDMIGNASPRPGRSEESVAAME
jgi:hypothetical protein